MAENKVENLFFFNFIGFFGIEKWKNSKSGKIILKHEMTCEEVLLSNLLQNHVKSAGWQDSDYIRKTHTKWWKKNKNFSSFLYSLTLSSDGGCNRRRDDLFGIYKVDRSKSKSICLNALINKADYYKSHWFLNILEYGWDSRFVENWKINEIPIKVNTHLGCCCCWFWDLK